MCFVGCCRYIHGDVLQRAVRQVRDATDVWLLSKLGAGLGVSEEGYPRRDTALRRGHHQPAGGRDGPILQFLPAGAQARRLRRYILTQVPREDDGGERPQVRRRLRHFLQDRQVSAFPCMYSLDSCRDDNGLRDGRKRRAHKYRLRRMQPSVISVI